VKLKVIGPPPPICTADNIFVPTAFSPNATGTNDMHCVFGTECIKTMTFNIFDRWGNKVFESTDPKACWDGTYNGQALDPAVFVYHLSATLNNGELVERQGNITLVR
jgi:gliding motility-associated-like protein